jgi:hypothetical protein
MNSMNDRQQTASATNRTEAGGVIQQLRRAWRAQSMEERYLSGATDLADLERRMRALERGSNVSVFVTFNH